MLEKVNINVAEATDYFYSEASEEQDAERRRIGHLRGDFGNNGEAFWATWFEHSPAMKTPDFRSELNGVVEELRQQGLLQSRCQMHDYCMQHPDARIPGAWLADVYGFCFQSAQHRYYLRCFPHAGDYNFYLYCYARPERLAERSSRPAHLSETPRKKSELER